MRKKIGIRREDKNIWERRVPLIPIHIKDLISHHQLEIEVQSFEKRVFTDAEFLESGAKITDEIPNTDVILAVKEVPKHLIEDKIYLFFSHTIKGQKHNMPLLQTIIDNKATLIDYELIKDAQGRRLVFFGRFAGLAGTIDALSYWGKRMKSQGIENPFTKIKSAYEYVDSLQAKDEIINLREEIIEFIENYTKNPIIIGIAGYGNVSHGVQEILDLLPITEIRPYQIAHIISENEKGIFMVVFKEEDLAQPKNKNHHFNLMEYYEHPELYEPVFEYYLRNITILINAVYWDKKYPRIVTKDFLKKNFGKIKLEMIQDISCDINGGIEITYKVNEPNLPCYVYNPENDSFIDGFEGEGIMNLAVDNLPTELPKNSSINFSESLKSFIPEIANADFNKPFEEIDLPDEIKNAIIVLNGELTPNFKYLNNFLINR